MVTQQEWPCGYAGLRERRGWSDWMAAQQEWPWGYAGLRESFLIYEGNRTACMRFYIQPLPIQGTIPDLIMHAHIF